MASITIRKLDDSLKAKLRVRAAREGRSMEDAAREILRQALSQKPRIARSPGNLGDALVRRFARLGGVELERFPRTILRDPPKFDE